MNLTIQEIASACNGKIINVSQCNIVSVSTDTRQIEPGALFVPIVGENFDGHDYIKNAIDKGAVCALTEKDISADFPLIRVESTRCALMQLAGYYRQKHDVKVVAVTGSAGKTTTKDMIYHILARKYKTKKTIGNFNNDIGMPLSIFQLTPEDEVLVLEMGMNHAAEIHELSLIGKPDIAVITHIGDAHIENFENREGILHAKLEIVDGLKPDGVVILNGNDPLLISDIARKKTNKFKVRYPSDNEIITMDTSSLVESHAEFNWNGNIINIKIPLPGAHMVMNAFLSVAVGMELGVSPDEIAKGFDDFVPPQGRLTIENIGGITVINDSYNANPTATIESIKIICKQPGRKVAILGDMFELGHAAKDRHFDVGAFVARSGIELLIAVGELAKYYCDGFNAEGYTSEQKVLYFPTLDDFINAYQDSVFTICDGDIVLLKASRGMAFEGIYGYILEKFGGKKWTTQ